MSQPIDRPEHDSILESHIKAVQESEQVSFHMPGHKGGHGAPARGRRLLGDAVYSADLSELSGFDYLHGAKSALVDAQQHAAQLFQSDQTWFLVNGATVGNIAAICSVVGDGDALLVARDSHRSVYAGIALAGAQPIYLAPAHNDALDGLFGIELNELDAALAMHPEVKALHITCPSYYGFTIPLRAIVKLAHDHDIPVIVDEAHGSHFVFDDRFPDSALSCGADLVVQSPHKTLGSLTQSSLLHQKGARIDRARISANLSMLQSSSPSALLLLSLDLAVDEMKLYGHERWQEVMTLAQLVRREVGAIERVQVYGDEIIGSPGISGYDPTKIVIDVDQLGTTGFAAGRWLHEEWKINPEFSDLRRMVFSITLGDSEQSAQVLIDAIRALGENRHLFEAHPNLISLWPGVLPVERMSPRQAQQSKSISLATAKAIGAISAEMIVPYPPGVPLLVAGEEISREIVDSMVQLFGSGCRIVGLADPSGDTLRVVCEN